MADAVLQVPVGGREHLDEWEVRKVLNALRPRIADIALGDLDGLARLISVAWEVVSALPQAKRRQIVGDKDALRAAMLQAWGGESRDRASAKPGSDGTIEHSRGTGLGERISVAEGRARLDRYAASGSLESWAGPTAGAGEIEHELGIPRSTLSNWRARGAAVGLLRGERKLAYPLEQFVDARPIQGISDVLRVAPDERAAWLWLRQPHAALEGKLPLDVLKGGGREAVARVAERDFA